METCHLTASIKSSSCYSVDKKTLTNVSSYYHWYINFARIKNNIFFHVIQTIF